MAQINPFPNPETGAYGTQHSAEDSAQSTLSRPGTATANPPSTSLPPSIKLESDAPPPIPSTGKVPFFNPVETPRAAIGARTVNKVQPNMSVGLDERFINEAVGGDMPLMPNVIARAGNQELTNMRPKGPADQAASGANAVGSGPIVNPQQPPVTSPVVGPPSPEVDFE